MTSTLSDLTQDFLKDPTATWEAFKASLKVLKKQNLNRSDYVEINNGIAAFIRQNLNKDISYWNNGHEKQKINDVIIDKENDADTCIALSLEVHNNFPLFQSFGNDSGIFRRIAQLLRVHLIR